MPDLPRDPRQLARDILAGKVRIEDLQRERQLRGAGPGMGGGGVGGAGPRLPAKIPLPRTAPPQRPVQRQPAPPLRQPPAFPQRQPQRPVLQRPPQLTIPAPPPPPRPVAQVVAPAPEPLPGAKAPRRSLRLNDLVRSKHALRQGILLAEVLGKPVSLRDQD